MKLKRLMGVLMALAVMLAPGMGLMAHAEGEVSIEEMTFTIEAPEGGTTVTSTEATDGSDFTQNPIPSVSVPDGVPYYVEAAYWVVDDGSVSGTPYSGTMEAGETYTALVVLAANDGYTCGPYTAYSAEGGTNLRMRDVEPVDVLPILVDVVATEPEPIEIELTMGPVVCGDGFTATPHDSGDYVWYSYDPNPDVSISNDFDGEIEALYWLYLEDGDGTHPMDYTPYEEGHVYTGGETAYIGVEIIGDFNGPDEPVVEFREEGAILRAAAEDGVTVTAVGAEVAAQELMYSEMMVVVLSVPVEHIPGDPVEENTVAPTCLDDGSHDEVVRCTACEAEISRETVTDPALGHDWGDWAVSKEPQVGVAGEEQRICRRDASHVETRPLDPLEAEETTAEETTAAETTPSNGPVTGDSSHAGTWIAAAAVACAGLIGTAVYSKKRR